MRPALERAAAWCARRPGAAVVLLSTAFAVYLSWPVVLSPATLLYGYPGDATGTVAIFWWWSYALHHGQPLLYNTLVGGPLGSGWELIPFDALQIALLAPLSFLVGPVAAYNLFALAGYPLTALFTYLLGRRLGMRPLAAAFAGLAFAFVPFHTEKVQGHLMESHMEYLPAFLWLALRWTQGGSWWNLAAAGAVAGLTLLNDTYMAYILLLMAVVYAAVSALVSTRPGRPPARSLRAHLLGVPLVAGTALLFAPLWLAAGARSGGGVATAVSTVAGELHRTLQELVIFSARPREYVLPWHANPLLPASIRAYEAARLHGSNFTEQSLFLGYTVMALAAIGAVAAVRGRRWFGLVLTVAIAAAGFLFSMPPTAEVAGLTLHFPSDLLIRVISVFRVYARFGMLVMLGSALLAGLGLEALAAGLRWRPAARTAILLLPFLTMGVEFNDVPPSRATAVLPGPAEYRWLRSQPAGLLVEYPLQAGPALDQEIATRQYSMYQMVHEHALFNGAAPGSAAARLEPRLEPYYAPESVTRMRELGVRYVFVHRAQYQAAGMQVPRQVPGLALVASFGGTDVFELGAGP